MALCKGQILLYKTKVSLVWDGLSDWSPTLPAASGAPAASATCPEERESSHPGHIVVSISPSQFHSPFSPLPPTFSDHWGDPAGCWSLGQTHSGHLHLPDCRELHKCSLRAHRNWHHYRGFWPVWMLRDLPW